MNKKYLLSIVIVFSFLLVTTTMAAPLTNLLGNYAVVGQNATSTANANFTASGTIAFITLSSGGSPCLTIGSTGLLSTSTCGTGSFTTTTINGLSATAYTFVAGANVASIVTTAPGTLTINVSTSTAGTATTTWDRNNIRADVYLVTSTDHVGIGTSTPTSSLDIANGVLTFSSSTLNLNYRTDGNSGASVVNGIRAFTLNNKSFITLFATGTNSSLYIGENTGTTTANAATSLYNFGFGARVFDQINGGDQNIGIGIDALTGTLTGSFNIGIGNAAGVSLTSGSDNTLIGVSTGEGLQTGADNVAIGNFTLATTLDGARNIAIGGDVTGNSTLGTIGLGANDNVGIGYQTGNNRRDASIGNTAIGSAAFQGSGDADNNTIVGFGAGDSVTTGNNNVFLGENSEGPTTGSNNFILCNDCSGQITTTSGNLNIMNSIYGTGLHGSSTVLSTTPFIGIGTSTPQNTLSIAGGLQVTSLVSCDSVDTTASGTLICGTDATGGGSGAESGWRYSAGFVRLSTSTDFVGIGAAVASTSLHVVNGTTTLDGRLRVRPSGNQEDGFDKGEGGVSIDLGSSTGAALQVESSAEVNGAGPLMFLNVRNSQFDAPILRIDSIATSSQGQIRIAAPSAEIEFIESDQTGSNGKFELRVQNNVFEINSRLSEDSSFEKNFTLRPTKVGGQIVLEYPNAAGAEHADMTTTFSSSSRLNIIGLQATSTGNYLGISSDTNSSGGQGVPKNDVFIITSSTRVGIGNPAPATQLHMYGSGAEMFRTECATLGTNCWNTFYTGNTAGGYIGLSDSGSLFPTGDQDTFTVRSTKSLRLQAGGSSDSKILQIASSTGNITIGTSTPYTKKLYVVGDIEATTNITSQSILSSDVTSTNIYASGTQRIPNGTAPILSVAGNIALDTTDDQLLIQGNGTTTLRAFPLEQSLFGVTIASSSLVNGVAIPIPKWTDQPRQLTKFICSVSGGTSVVVNASDDGTNDTNTITCNTTHTSSTVTTNSEFTEAELWRLEIGTVTGAVNYLSFEARGAILRK